MVKPKTKLGLRAALILAFVSFLFIGINTAIAADIELDNADGADGGAMANADNLVNAVDDSDDFLFVEIDAAAGNADEQVTNINSDFDGTITLSDTEATAANDLNVTGFVDIASSTTLTMVFNNSKSDSSGTDALNASGIVITGTTGEAGAGTLSRGGTLVLLGGTDIAADRAATYTGNGAHFLTALTAQGGGGGTNQGSAMTATLGDASGDAINILTLTATGGLGASDPGGLAQITVTGTLADATGGIDINGGAGAATAGGAATVTVSENIAALSGAVTVDGGGGTNNGDGGAAKFDTDGTVATSSNWTFTGGNGSSGGTGDGGAASLDAEGAITSTGRITFTGGNAGAGGTAAAGGASSGALNNTATTFAGITITGGNGGATNVSVGGNASLADVGALTSTDTILVTGGNGGTAAGASTGGTATLTAGSTSVLTGNVTVTGGNGDSNNAADGGAATVTFTDDVTATAQTLTITGGDGHASADGDGGAAKVEFIASGTFTSVVLGDGTAGNGTEGGATLEFDAAAAETFAGAITAAGDGQGTINVQNSNGTGLTVSGQIGTDSVRLKALNVLDGAATTGTFSSDVYADTITVDSTNAAATADFDGVVGATAIAVTDGASGNIATARFAEDVTAAITITDASGGDDGLVVFNGTTAQTMTGAIAGAAAGSGNIQVSNTTAGAGVTFTGAITNLHNLILDGSSISTFESTVAAGDVDVGDAANITLNGAVTLTGTVTLNNANSTTITIGKGQTYGSASSAATRMVSATDVVFSTTGAGTITVNMPSDFQSGHLVLYEDSNSGGISDNETATVAVTDTALVDYSVADGDGALYSGTAADEDIVIVATRKSAAAAAVELGVTAEAAQALGDAATALTGVTSATDIATQTALTNALAAGGETARKAASTVQGSPASSTAAGSAAVTSTGTQVIAVGSTRLASLRSGPAYASSHASGFAAGEDVLSRAVWMKPFVNFADQNRRKGIAGYETETYGAAIGGDFKVGNSTFGVSFSYANTDVDSKGDGNAQTDVDSYQGTFYADYTTKDWYVEGLFGYARNEISGSRSISINSLTAKNDYGSNQYMGNIGFGMPVEVDEGHYLTPNASIQYTLVDNETYTETGAGALNLRVKQDNVHQALGVFGVKYHTNSETDSGTFTPELRLSMTYDFANDEAVSTSNFTGGGPAFNVEGANVQEFGTRAGAGFSFMPLAATGLTIAANYDVWAREDFVSHSANASLRFDF